MCTQGNNYTSYALIANNVSLLSLGVRTERTLSTKPQLKDLVDALYHTVANKWEDIGIYLEFPTATLQAIAAEHQLDPHSCLIGMLEVWLKRVDLPPTWSAIIEAVEFLGEEQLGRALRDKYYGEHVNNASVT